MEIGDLVGYNESRIRFQSHYNSTFADSVRNIKATGRDLSPEDKKYLTVLLTHRSRWSATYPTHMNDKVDGLLSRGVS